MVTKESVIVVGAGGHSKVVISLLRALGHTIKGVLDDNVARHGEELFGTKILGPVSYLQEHPGEAAVIAIGNNAIRQKLSGLPARWISAVHPFSWVDESVTIGEGTLVFAGAVVQPSATLGRHVVINTSASVDHDCRIEDFVQIAPGAHLGGGVHIKQGTFIGLGATVNEYKSVGAWCTIGAGSAVVKDISDHLMAVGVPAILKVR